MYAFIHASNFRNKSDIRMTSIGAGSKTPVKINPNETNAFTWLLNLEDMIINTEITTHVFLTRELAEDYHRWNVVTDIELDDMDGHSI